jgi:hypothetical protein
MTEPSSPRPVPGPARPGPGQAASSPESGQPSEAGAAPEFADLEERPLSEHVAVFEAEHARLQRELGTIDRL